jgi:glycosyltransferase involved in cell wall biosynthesis
VSPDKIETIPNAIDPSDYNPEWNCSIAHIVFISNLIGRKGVRELIEAIHRVDQSSSREYRVTIAGKGPLSSNVEELAVETDCVDYRGFVSEREKRSIIESGSIYVLPSYAEGLPIAILEGMAGGNAIVSTTVGSIPEVVSKDNGITVEPRDVDGLESAIRELIDNPERTEKMGRRSRKLADEQYSWEYVAGRLKKVYRDCVDERYSA